MHKVHELCPKDSIPPASVDELRLSKYQIGRGLLIAALFGWFGNTTLDVGGLLAVGLLSQGGDALDNSNWVMSQLGPMIAPYAIFGIPLAIFMTFILGFPFCRDLETKGELNQYACMKTGAKAGLLIWGIGFAISIFFGHGTALDPNSSPSTSAYGYEMTNDGLPTALGLFLQVIKAAGWALT